MDTDELTDEQHAIYERGYVDGAVAALSTIDFQVARELASYRSIVAARPASDHDADVDAE